MFLFFRFRMSKNLFLRIMNVVEAHDDYFVQKRNAANVLGMLRVQETKYAEIVVGRRGKRRLVLGSQVMLRQHAMASRVCARIFARAARKNAKFLFLSSSFAKLLETFFFMFCHIFLDARYVYQSLGDAFIYVIR